MTVIVGDWPGGVDQRHKLILPVGKVSGLVERAWLSLATGWDDTARGHLQFIASPAMVLDAHEVVLTADVRSFWEVPNGADQINVVLTSGAPVAWTLELLPYGYGDDPE